MYTWRSIGPSRCSVITVALAPFLWLIFHHPVKMADIQKNVAGDSPLTD